MGISGCRPSHPFPFVDRLGLRGEPPLGGGLLGPQGGEAASIAGPKGREAQDGGTAVPAAWGRQAATRRDFPAP